MRFRINRSDLLGKSCICHLMGRENKRDNQKIWGKCSLISALCLCILCYHIWPNAFSPATSAAPTHTWPLVFLRIAFPVCLELKYINIYLPRWFGQAGAFQCTQHQVLALAAYETQPLKVVAGPSLAPLFLHKCIHWCGRRESPASANESCCLHVQYIEYCVG